MPSPHVTSSYRFVFKYGDTPGTVITGGAGHSHSIDCANQELHSFFSREIKKGDDILSALNIFARNFFEESMRGYQGLDADLVPHFEMLIAVNIRNEQTRLFCWKENRVVMLPADGHATVGSGVVQIHPMLRDTQFAGRCDAMLFLGIRMMYHAKRAVTGVGGKTEAIALYDDATTQIFGTDATQRIEELVIDLEQILNLSVYQDISAVTLDVKSLETNVQKNLAELPRLMQMYRDAYSKILNPPSVSRKSKGRR